MRPNVCQECNYHTDDCYCYPKISNDKPTCVDLIGEIQKKNKQLEDENYKLKQ